MSVETEIALSVGDLTIAPCIRCRTRAIQVDGSDEKRTLFRCFACNLEHEIQLPAFKAIGVWNEIPRLADKDMGDILEQQISALRNTHPTRLERLVIALVSSGRVPASQWEPHSDDVVSPTSELERAPKAIVDFCRRIEVELDRKP